LSTEDLAHGSLGKLGQAIMPCRRPVLACVAGQQSRRPKLVRVAQLLGLPAGQIHQPSPRLRRDRALFAGPGQVVECRLRTIGNRALHAALDGLTMHAQSPAHRKARRVIAIGQEHLRTHHPARRFRSRPRDCPQPQQVLFSDRQLKHLTPRRHHLHLVQPPRGDKMGILTANAKHAIGSLESIA
jgi:hypothetical protein